LKVIWSRIESGRIRSDQFDFFKNQVVSGSDSDGFLRSGRVLSPLVFSALFLTIVLHIFFGWLFSGFGFQIDLCGSFLGLGSVGVYLGYILSSNCLDFSLNPSDLKSKLRSDYSKPDTIWTQNIWNIKWCDFGWKQKPTQTNLRSEKD
jgi:hypothetical protein